MLSAGRGGIGLFEKLAAGGNRTRAAFKAGPWESVGGKRSPQILAEIKAKYISLNCLLSVTLVVKFWGLESTGSVFLQKNL